MPLPERLAAQPFDEVQVTLVDCPGHASLIRTIIGGAQIVDMAILVVDVTKGEWAPMRLTCLDSLVSTSVFSLLPLSVYSCPASRCLSPSLTRMQSNADFSE